MIGNAVKVMRIAAGEESDELPNDGQATPQRGRSAKRGAGMWAAL